MKDVKPRIPGTSRKTKRMVLNAKLSGQQRSCACRVECISRGRTTLPSRSKQTPDNKQGCFTSVLFKAERENGNGRATRKPPGLSSRKRRVWDWVYLRLPQPASRVATLKS